MDERSASYVGTKDEEKRTMVGGVDEVSVGGAVKARDELKSVGSEACEEVRHQLRLEE